MNSRVCLPVLLLLALAGCTTRPVAPVPAGPAGSPVAKPVPANFYPVWIESEPSGATVVVDGVPQGRTPLRVAIPGSARGFFRTETSIRVRFVAADAGQVSATIEERFAPTDRIPTRLDYTPLGVRRTR